MIGDNGTGNAPQFEVARKMEAYYEMVNYSFVIMLGDNIYGRHSPEDLSESLNSLTNHCLTPE